VSELADEHDSGSCAERRGGSSHALPHFAEVVNEPLGDTDTFGFGKILSQVKGEAIKGGIARMNSCPDFGNLEKYNCY
jgi:hypothetical protein